MILPPLRRAAADAQTVATVVHEGQVGPLRRDHVVNIGYGRVGSSIGATLQTWDLPHVVVERDRRRVPALRASGTPAEFGEATAPASWMRPASARPVCASSPRPTRIRPVDPSRPRAR